MAAGLRVIRGPGWALDDDDGGEGHVGTLVEVGDGGIVNITWDGGQVSLCRAAKDLGHDLRVLDNASVGIRHTGITCDVCYESGIKGMRWKCSECINFDLCTRCYFNDKHDRNHRFHRIETPKSEREIQERRSKSTKQRVLGIYPDATVTRGMDWEGGDEDGGKGCTGLIINSSNPSAESAHSMVEVEWENGTKKSYRVGYNGKVDLQYIEEAPGPDCYTQHLPLLDIAHYKTDIEKEIQETEEIKEGDSVIITYSADELQQVQKSRSGWSVGMAEYIGKVGRVLGFVPIGDAIVSFGKRKYRLFPGALKKVSSTAITAGSRVRIIDDEERVKSLQREHGGYTSRMRSCLGKVGEVVMLDNDGDAVIQFGGCQWVFALACCIPAPGADIDDVSIVDDEGNHMVFRMGQTDGMLECALLFKAIADMEEETALGLLSKHPNLAKEGFQGLTALHAAANRGLLRLSAALVEAGADLNCKDRDGDTPLLAAMAGRKTKVAEYLIHQGCDVFKSNDNGQTAGHKAAIIGSTQVLRALVAAGADFSAQDDTGDTPLHDAITKEDAAAAEVILTCPRVDLYNANKTGHPPLHYACLRDEPQIVEYILQYNSSVVNERKRDGYTPLHVSACNNHYKSMQILLEKGGADVSVMNNELMSPLHVAAYYGAIDCVKLLVQAGSDVNGRDGTGSTALHLTTQGPDTEEAATLILHSKNLSKGDRGETRAQMALFLLEHGADPDARNFDEQRAIDICPSRREVVKIAIREFMSKSLTAASDKKPTSMETLSISAAVDESFAAASDKIPASMETLSISAAVDESFAAASDKIPASMETLSISAAVDKSTCSKCQTKEPESLFIPCLHRVFCKDCCTGVSKCPQCNETVKETFMRWQECE